MKAKKKTYGIHGMMEYQTVVYVGKTPIKIMFTDGSLNALGSKPAVYTTDNFIIQQAIENSEKFKSGLIVKVREVELDKEIKILRNDSGNARLSDESDEPKESGASDGAEEEAVKVVEVKNNDEAREYLEKNFGVAPGKMRIRNDIIAQGALHGVEFKFNA